VIVNVQTRRAGIPYFWPTVQVNSLDDMRAKFAADGFEIDGYFVVDNSPAAGPLGTGNPVNLVIASTGQRVTVSDPQTIANYIGTGTASVLRPDGTLAGASVGARAADLPQGPVPHNWRPNSYDPASVVIDGIPLLSRAGSGLTNTNIPGGGAPPVPPPSITGMPQAQPVAAAPRFTVSIDDPASAQAASSYFNGPTTPANDLVRVPSGPDAAKKNDDLILGLGVAILAKVFLGL
jgi:hypothetical protein